MKKQTKKITLDNVLTVIRKWQQNNDVTFVGSFGEFDEKGEVKNDRLIAYGGKELIKIQFDSLRENLKKDKEKFINW